MYILGISAFYHDSAACLVKDGEIIAAAQEERFTRLKNDASFPEQAIRFCLNYAGIRLREVSYVAFYEKPFLKFERLVETYLAFAPHGIRSFWKSMPVWIKEKLFQKNTLIKKLQTIDPDWTYTRDNLLFTEHHQSHAASAFYPSPFSQALILTIDGVGEWTTTSVATGRGNRIERVKEIHFPHSIGLLYAAFTYYLGFQVNADEYKVMGLAPYGTPRYVQTILENLIDIKEDGSFRLNMAYFNYCTGLTMTGTKFHRLFGQPPRSPKADLTGFHMDMACSVQKVTEEWLLKLANHAYAAYGLENLCMAGGVALNCVANGRVMRETRFKNVWIQPAAGDAGGALGAALAVWYDYLENTRCQPPDSPDCMKNALLGPSFSMAEVRPLLLKHGLAYVELEDTALFDTIAGKLDQGKVIGFFRGRMEFGPRALGARSIIGDPRNPRMQSVMNLKVKFRESFRPFAPAVLEEQAHRYFTIQQPNPYMLVVGEVLKEHLLPVPTEQAITLSDKINGVRSTIPAVTHVDYSARVQTVNAHENPNFYRLIQAFYTRTGCPLVINTSFNTNNEPIVCTPEDAIRCFLKSDIDLLVLENSLLEKPIPTQ